MVIRDFENSVLKMSLKRTIATYNQTILEKYRITSREASTTAILDSEEITNKCFRLTKSVTAPVAEERKALKRTEPLSTATKFIYSR